MFSIRKYSDGSVILAGGRRMLRCEYDPENILVTPENGLLYIRAKKIDPENSFRFTAEDSVEGAMANYCILDCWQRPWFGRDFGEIPALTQSLLWRERDTWCVLLPVSDKANVFLRGEGKGETCAAFECAAEGEQLMLVMAAGDNPYVLADKAVRAATKEVSPDAVPVERRRYPEMFEYLGWCTWDACYRNLKESVVTEKFQEFYDKRVPARWVILDDGWQSLREEKLYVMEADREKFPQGFASMKDTLAREYGLRWLGVWHALSAFYNGIHPDSPLIGAYGDHLVRNQEGEYYPAPAFPKAYRFFADWYAYLKAQGVDFVKVDLQSWATYRYYQGERNPASVAEELGAAAEAAGTVFFDGHVLNCMGMREENVFHRSYTAVSRNSMDYLPHKVDILPEEQQGFHEHALQNAYNAVFHSAFIRGDWDMWWTSQNDSVRNAVLRAVSGGPVYVSDRVGDTDEKVLMPLVFSDGRVIRCDDGGKPSRGCLLRDPYREKVPMKIYNRLGRYGVVAVFNLYQGEEPMPCAVGAEDAEMAGACIAYEYFTGEAKRLEDRKKCSFTLLPGEVRLYTFYPGSGGIVPIGLAGKYIPGAAILYEKRFADRTVVLLRDGGRFAFYADKMPACVRVNGTQKTVTGESELYYVDCNTENGQNLCVEIEY
ncbi:MAG: Sip1-related alpha-galactosidase [Clostridiaceae bacterium]|nr:Sip1-related alpha-galactosidase [Clostridiaceae bacterium]